MLETCSETLQSCVGDLSAAIDKSGGPYSTLDLLRKVESGSVQGCQMLETCNETPHPCVSDFFTAINMS